MFTKAMPKQAYLKALFYGPKGSGKTFTALLMAEGLAKMRGGRVAFVDSEFMGGGSDFYAQALPRPAHPDAFDFDRLETLSLKEAIAGIQGLDPAVHKVIVIDSLSHYWQAAMDAYEGRMVGKGEDKIPIQAWGKIKRPFKGDLIQWLIASPFDVICCARQKNVYDTSGGDWTLERFAPRTEGETEYEFPLELRMSEKRQEGKASAWLAHVEKDRTGILAGRTIPNPDFSTIAGIVAILGPEAREAPDEDERMAADSELLDDPKAAQKAAKSGGLLARFQAEIANATTPEALGQVQAAIKKDKRYMLEEHLNALRVLFDEKRTLIVAATMGEV
jgi:hypothetical protein